MNETRNNICAVIAIAAGVLAALGSAQAQETGKVMIDVAECIKLDAPEARLACYESRVAAMFGERAAQAAAVRPAPPVSAAAAAVRQSQQAEAPPAAAPAVRRPQQAEALPAEEIVSRVKELRETVPNSYVITLENGQVWRQTVAKQYRLRPGMQVRIRGTHWGSASRLTADEINSYIQVERVR
jgi:hypothetical protein